jgi:1-phosphofructokinase family hexose kinase
MRIFTLTLSPVIDVHFALEHLRVGVENFPGAKRVFAAGKGVNVTRALGRHGVDASAYVLLGNDDADRYLSLLRRDGLAAEYVTGPGEMREYISLNSAGDNTETRICHKPFRADGAAVNALCGRLLDRTAPGDIVCISGGLPRGVSVDNISRISRVFRNKGVRVALDSAAFDADEIAAAAPWLIKPNLAEAKALLDIDAAGAEPASLASRLTALAPNVLLSLGPDGALFASRSAGGSVNILSRPADPVPHCYSTVGAGDNLLAGFLFSLLSSGLTDDGPVPPEFAASALASATRFAAELCGQER